MSSSPGSSSPKRKRNPPLTSALKNSPARLTTSIPENIINEVEFRAESPRTKVAHRFENLQLNGAGVSKLDFSKSAQFNLGLDSDSDSEALPKRVKMTDVAVEIPDNPPKGSVSCQPGNSSDIRPFESELDPVIFKGAANAFHPLGSSLVRAYPSINRLMDSKSRAPKRTSNLVASASTSQEDEVIDIDRASMTWHDDEITGHDPDDPEDDGEGINGIGFRPTPAMARMRAEKRRQQLAEYRSRESREARAKRSERRRASPTLTATSKIDEPPRKVRFMEERVT